MSETVLIVDDDAAFRRSWSRLLASEGYTVVEAADAPSALTALRDSRARLVLLDLMLPPSGTPEAGAALLPELLSLRPEAKIVVASGASDLSLALSLVRSGAHDFLQKPIDPDVLISVLARACARLSLEDRVSELTTSLSAAANASGLVGSAPKFLEAERLAERAAVSDVPVLLRGESGTGKEVFARYVHARSRRANGPFVALNCGAISPQLLESSLFGHKKGAFTGATSDARGLFVEAHGGTLLLDEIGDLALDLQVKLLRTLESGEVLPVGSSKTMHVDVRIVSATHRPLEEMQKSGGFRDDLYWRIRGIEIELPRLSERAEDIVVLAQHFLNQARAIVPGSATPKLSGDAIRCLETHAWPGNLRELRHEMQRALVMAAGRPVILPEDLSPQIQGKTPAAPSSEGKTLEEKIALLERSELVRALDEHGNNKSRAAEALGLSRQGLLNKLARYGLRSG
jgi:DNA-binding NtrC family response regulator